jgi:UDP-N-acetylglucosamine:LPS N-acetylglucosamine transferase
VSGRRVLIVYSRVGGGHASAAFALHEALCGSAAAVDLVDAYATCGRPPVTWFPALYAELARNHRHLWSFIYRSTQHAADRVDGDRLLAPFLLPALRRLLSDRAPDVVVSVLPAINGLLGTAAAGAASRPRLDVVLTDWYDVHPTWVGRGVDGYTVPTDAARLDLVRYGAAPDQVEVVGLPVRLAFAAPPPRATARDWLAAEHGLDPGRFTIVVMVGAEGSPNSLSMVQALLMLDVDAQVVVVCGHDGRLRRRVAQLPRRAELRALGFVAEVPGLMRAADVLVTKAGGVSLAEAFCCAAPIVVADPLAGQEAGNLTYALQHGAVVEARSPQALAHAVRALAQDPARRAALAERAAALARPNAATRIAARLVSD